MSRTMKYRLSRKRGRYTLGRNERRPRVKDRRDAESVRADLAMMGEYMNANPPTMTDMMVYSDLVQELAVLDAAFAADVWEDAK